MPRGRNKVWFESSPGGIRGDLNPATIPKWEWLSGNNMLVRDGVTIPRPGVADPYSALTAADEVIGLRVSQTDSYDAVASTLVQTRTKTYMFVGGTGTDLTGSWTTSTQPTRFERFFSSADYLLRVNPDNKVAKSTGVISPADSFATIAASEAAYDICTIPPYVILGGVLGGTYNNAVRWCSANDVDTWPSSNVQVLPGRDFVSSVRAFDSRSFVIFTRSELWVGQLQAAKTAFQFSRVAQIHGPSGPSNVVSTKDGLFWIGTNFGIYHFDGARVHYIESSPHKLFRSQNVSFVNDGDRYPIGVSVQRQDPEVWWFYAHSGATYAAISLNLRTGKVFPHTFGSRAIYSACTCATDGVVRADAILGGSAGQVYYLQPSQYTDAGTAIPWNFEYGYVPTCDNVNESGEIDAVASYWKKTSSSCTVTVSLTPSDSISDDETTYTDTFDTSTATSNHSKTFRGKQGKWAKLKFSGTSVVADLEYRGALLTSWQRSMT